MDPASLARALLDLSACPDLVENKGHAFGSDLSPDAKRAVIEYLKTPPDRATLLRLITDAGLTPRGAVRQKETLFKELGLGDASVSEDAILDAMLAHPILIERPFVVTEQGTRLSRPSEKVLEVLPPLPGPFTKEDGEIIAG